jgi:hypothetical protein
VETPAQSLVRLTVSKHIEGKPLTKEFVAAAYLLRMATVEEILTLYEDWQKTANPAYGGYSLSAFKSVFPALLHRARGAAGDGGGVKTREQALNALLGGVE